MSDFVKDAVFLAEENRKKDKEIKELQLRVMRLQSALTDMQVVFKCLTEEGGWDTMDVSMKRDMLKYSNNALKTSIGEEAFKTLKIKNFVNDQGKMCFKLEENL